MKGAVYYRTGGPEVLSYEDVADPEPGPHDVLVRAEAISIEGGDTLSRARGELTSTPHVVGYQCAGRVVAAGAEATRFGPGERVVTVGLDGSHAELRAVPEAFCWPVPDDLSIEEAACIPVPFGTADDCLFEFGRLEAGQTVLVHAGASGVGLAAIQLAKQAGARVFATASSPAKLERLGEFGLDEGIDYVHDDFVAEVRRLTGGRGADVVVDSVGGTTLQGSLACLAYRGRCVTLGDADRGAVESIDVSGLRISNQVLAGYFMGAELVTGERVAAVVARHIEDVAEGRLRVVIDRTFPLAEAAAAHAYIESRQAFGRVVLIP